MKSCYAGPCAQQIAQSETRIDARLHRVAEAGRFASETVSAKRHIQPTIKSVADAEVEVGDLPAAIVAVVEQAMEQARNADNAGARVECLRALRTAQRALGD